MTAVRYLAFVEHNFGRHTKSTSMYISLCKFLLKTLLWLREYESLNILSVYLKKPIPIIEGFGDI